MSDTRIISINFEGVRITPEFLIFKHAYEGKSYREKIVFQNISSRPLFITTKFEQSYPFTVENHLRGMKLSSGMKVKIYVKYTYKYSTVNNAVLLVYINDKVYYYRMTVQLAAPVMECDPKILSFGKINLGHAVHTQKLTLINKGHRQAKFEFDLSHNNLGLTLTPIKGFVPGLESIEVEVDIVGIEEGNFCKDIWIKCENPFRFTVLVEVILPKLYINSPKDYTGSFLPISFPPTYSGCKHVKSFSIFNHNTLHTTFIIVPEINFNVMTLHKVQKLDSSYKNFFITPIEGTLKPHEISDITISFEPFSAQLKKDKIFFNCYRLIKLDCLEVTKVNREIQKVTSETVAPERVSSEASLFKLPDLDIVSNTSIISEEIGESSDTNHIKRSFDEFVRVCVYAVVKPLNVNVEPKHFIKGKMSINDKSFDVLKISNMSDTLPIYFRYVKTGFISLEPKEGMINIKDTATVKVTFVPTAACIMDNPIRINFLYYNKFEDRKEVKVVGSISIPVHVPVEFNHPIVKPRFNMGITPEDINEVGFLTDEIRFNDPIKKPNGAMLQIYQKKPWLKHDNAIIAFPNNMSRSLKPNRNKCKTIFAGLPRAVVTYDEYSFSPEELEKRQKNEKYYLDYIHKMQVIHLSKTIRMTKPQEEEYLPSDSKVLQHINTPLKCVPYEKTMPLISNLDFLPLKPIQNYFFHITPNKIYIGKIVVLSTVSYKLEIKNENHFPVCALLTSFHAHKKTLPEIPEQFIVNANSKLAKVKQFTPLNVGIFNTIINVYLNNRHLVPILFFADVVRPVVTLDSYRIVIDEKCENFNILVPVRNELNIPVNFFWTVPDSCYTMKPMSGSVPPGKFIYCELKYTPDFEKNTSVTLIVNCVNGTPVLLDVTYCNQIHDVMFLNSVIEVPHIPLNILTIRKNTIRNCGNKTALFIVKNCNPSVGVTVYPDKGYIPSRSDFHLEIHLLIRHFIKFQCRIEVEFDHSNCISFLLTGEVEFPAIEFLHNKPINIGRVPAESFEITPFTIQNISKSIIHLSFPKNMYPEITISGRKSVTIERNTNTEFSLEEGQSVVLYIHFYPLDVCLNDFYLPVVINEMIGPVLKDDTETHSIEYFVKNVETEPGEDFLVEKIDYKVKIPVLNVLTISSRHILRFSKTSLRFKYFPSNSKYTVVHGEIKIKNCLPTCIQICINFFDSVPHFCVTCKQNEDDVILDTDCMAMNLEENQEVTFNVSFLPSVAGDFYANFPLYINDSNYSNVFNYIRVKATYYPPHFKSPRWFFLEPVPLNFGITRDFDLTLINHYKDCQLSVECDLEQLTLIKLRTRMDNDNPFHKIVTFRLVFISPTQIATCKKVNFECTCKETYFIIIGVVADDAILSIYMHYYEPIAMEGFMKSRGYPYFCEESDMSEWAQYMRKCVSIMERWIFTQLCHMTLYYFIPESMNDFYRYINPKQPTQTPCLFLTAILRNITGQDIVPPPTQIQVENQLERINYIHCCYKYIINFLAKQGAYFPHIRSRYLFNYENYITYMKKIRPQKPNENQSIKTEQLFYLRSKQCWLDLFIQIFKVLVFEKITLRRIQTNRTNSILNAHSSFQSSYAFLSPQRILLTWLSDIYDHQRYNVLQLDETCSENLTIPMRHVSNFTSDLADGLVFIAVTIHYCPYLATYFKDIYVFVDSPEKAFHNAVLLTEAWKMINSSFEITPSEISNPIALQMLLFVTYMYDAFPNFMPKEDVTFSVGLSQSEQREIMIRNPNSVEIIYQIKFLGNERTCFSSPSGHLIRIAPNKIMKVRIDFKAKFIENQLATLLFCGDIPGEKYAKSIVYNLLGESTFLGEHKHETIEINLYKLSETNIMITSPYTEEASYDIYYASAQPKDVTPETLIPIKHLYDTIRPKTLYTKQNKITADENGLSNLQVIISSICTGNVNITLCFINKDIGDFYISLEIVHVNFNQLEKTLITIDLPDNWENMKCICTNNKLVNPLKCPRNLILKIPCKNDAFWNVLIESILLMVPENEADVWNKYIESEMGPYIVRWLSHDKPTVSETKTIDHIFAKDVTYLLFSANSGIKLPTTVKIANVRSSGYIDVNMHISEELRKIKSHHFSLQSEDESELRMYHINFKRASEVSHSSVCIENLSTLMI